MPVTNGFTQCRQIGDFNQSEKIVNVHFERHALRLPNEVVHQFRNQRYVVAVNLCNLFAGVVFKAFQARMVREPKRLAVEFILPYNKVITKLIREQLCQLLR